jgi:hypothetical protein
MSNNLITQYVYHHLELQITHKSQMLVKYKVYQK